VVRHPRGDEHCFLDTAFLIQAGRGLFLFGLSSALAFPFGAWYHQPRLAWLLIAASFQILVQGFTSSSLWTLTRNIENDKLAKLYVCSDLTGLAVSLIWASLSPTAWALVAGSLARPTVTMIGSFLLADRPFKFEWDRTAAHDIFSFGGGMFLSSVTFFFVSEAERLVVAKFITLAELGCYSLAMTISSVPDLAFGHVISKVFLPTIAKSAQESPERAVINYDKMRRVLIVLCLFFSFGYIVFGKLAVNLVLGSKYFQAGWMVQLLGFRGSFQLFSGAATAMLFALGYSRYAAISNIARMIFLAIGLPIAFGFYTFREALWVLALSPLIAYIPLLVGIHRHLRPALKTELLCTATFLVLSSLFCFIHPLARAFAVSLHFWNPR
jgi:O-antigen/teichoic acid export membrane protein